jgi:hypothetical protein
MGGREVTGYSDWTADTVVFARTCHNPTVDEVAPRIRRSDRPMASHEAGRGNDGRRRTPGGFGTLLPTDDGNLSLGRKIGVLVVLAALGGAIILAAGGVGGGRTSTPLVSPSATAGVAIAGTPRPITPPPTGVPTITPPKATLVTTRAIDLRLTVPDPGTTMDGLEVRIYRNTKLLKAQPVLDTGRIKVKGVPLRRGSNHLTATLGNTGGDGPRSAAVSITVDDQAPKIKVRSPRNLTTLNQDRVTITGRTDGGLTVTGKDSASGSTATTAADAAGAFSFSLRLAPGRNSISIRARDVAGNLGAEQLVIVRGDGRPSVQLRLSRKTLPLTSLPLTIDAHVTVLDANGRPVQGAKVAFAIAPPGQLTDTFEATTKADGTADWSGIRIVRQGTTRGDGLVTARAVLPRGGAAPDKTVHFQIK